MVTHHSVFITHHLKHPTPFGTITHLSSLNIFQLFVGPIPVPCATFTFFLSFFLQPLVPKLTESSEKKIKIKIKTKLTKPRKKRKKKKKEELKTEPVKEGKKKRKKREEELKTKQWKKKKIERERGRIEDRINTKKKIPNPEKKGKKKKTKVKGQKLRLWVLPCVFNYKKCHWVMSYRNWKQLKCVFSFHNSKIRELSDGNWVTDHEWWSPNKCSYVGPTNFGSWVMKTIWYHSKLS